MVIRRWKVGGHGLPALKRKASDIRRTLTDKLERHSSLERDLGLHHANSDDQLTCDPHGQQTVRRAARSQSRTDWPADTFRGLFLEKQGSGAVCMDQEALLAHLTDALKSITSPRLYETERGFQGALLAELQKAIPGHLLSDGAVIEQEYQKRLHMHGLKVRPDIIIHEPFDETRHKSRREGNIAVIELKRAASQKDASDDFVSLAKMMEALAYPMAAFINIASETTHAALEPISKCLSGCG